MPPSLCRPVSLAFLALCGLAGIVLQPWEVQAQGSYVIADATSGHVLEAHGQRDKRQVASLTKIATAMVVLDWCELRKINLGELVTIPAQAIRPELTNPIGFQPGDRMSVRDLVFCMMLQSDNIAAEALAIHFGPQLPGDAGLTPMQRFVQQMNALARNLRMDRTLFLNPNGVDNAEQPYSTALDMARLTKHAISKAAFRFFVTQKERRVAIQRGAPAVPTAATVGAPMTSSPATPPGASEYLLRNTNELLGRNEIDGVKTGQTNRAGPCLIISAMKPPIARQVGKETQIWPRRLIVVVLGSPDRFNESLGLLQRGWTQFDEWSALGRKMNDVKNEL
jgi:D-alanyl-D-alanine carboxypeptidase (penicillin-binding protein 5/6)